MEPAIAAPGAGELFAAFCQAGLWPGLGRTLAAALPGAGITTAAEVNAGNLAKLPKVGAQRAGRLLSAFIAAAPVMDVLELLLPAGLEPRLAGRAVEALGAGAAHALRADPWALLGAWGVRPPDADRLARALEPQVSRDDRRRARALVGYVLARASREGHTCLPRSAVARGLAEFGISGAGAGQAAVQAAIQAATDSGQVLAYEVAEGTALPADPAGQGSSAEGSGAGDSREAGAPEPAGQMLALVRFAQAEDAVAQGIARLLATAEPIAPADTEADAAPAGPAGAAPCPPGPVLDEVQMSAVHKALESGVSVLTGGPGTGKSRTVATLVELAAAAGRSVALAAPTGRAAKRLEELCAAPAATLHRLLGAQARGSDDDGLSFDGGFQRGEQWPLDENVVVVDEASMLDAELAAALLDACADGTHLVFVGDAAQLPSIGAGRVLGDLIDSGTVPVTELRTLYRHDAGGTIARLASAVRQGELPPISDPAREVVIVPASGSAEAAHRVVQLVTDSIPRALGIGTEQIQVITPVHRGQAGTAALNTALKARLNPGTGRRRFDVGDRVVATANHLEAEPVGFANGEVGQVSAVDPDGAVTVEFASGPAQVRGKALGDITHGWAITVHRAQGSEFAAVVFVVPPEAAGMASRPLIYTGLTRAQRHLSVVHAAGPALARAVRQVGTIPRQTHLRDLLTEYAHS